MTRSTRYKHIAVSTCPIGDVELFGGPEVRTISAIRGDVLAVSQRTSGISGRMCHVGFEGA